MKTRLALTSLAGVLALACSGCWDAEYAVPPSPPPPPSSPPPGLEASPLPATPPAPPARAPAEALPPAALPPLGASSLAEGSSSPEAVPPVTERVTESADARVAAAPPPASAWVQAYPEGQWVYLADRGWTWIPIGASAYAIEGVPYTYLYTPTLGWNWYVSPWGFGGYRYGGWVRRPWAPAGWAAGRGGWGGWVAHPSIGARLGYGHRGGFGRGGGHAGGGHGGRR